MNNRQRAAIVEALVALNIGILPCALNVFLLRRLATPMVRVLLWPKDQFSELIGDLAGWSAHVKQSDPIGLWLQFALITAVAAAAAFFVLRLVSVTPCCRGRISAYPGILAVSLPWLCLLLLVDTSSLERVGVIQLIVFGGPIMAVAMCVNGTLLIHKKRWPEHRGKLGVGFGAAILLYLVIVRSFDAYAGPVGYFALGAALSLHLSWVGMVSASSVPAWEMGRRCRD